MKVNKPTPHRVAPKPIQESPKQTPEKKNLFGRIKDTANKTLQKTKETVSKQSEKIRNVFQKSENSSTSHVADDKARELVGSSTRQADAHFARLHTTQNTQATIPGAGGGGGTTSIQGDETLNGTTLTTDDTPVPAGPIDAESIHMNQYDGDPNSSNADCGPTSMSMALRAVGLAPEGATHNDSTVDTVQAMRQSMYPDDASMDGVTVDAEGEVVRNDAEHSQWTTFTGLITGAEAAGATVTQIAPNTDEIAESVQNGHPVVVNGNPGEDGGGWSDSYNSGHFITVSGYNEETETFTINDPLDDGPREVSKEDLDNYMEGWSWRALSISNPNASNLPPALPSQHQNIPV
ncbi:MAG TPA: hypothetical protein DCE42_02230 [Myxococcales bacterium]|nr:hypothetical protein [Deltaproteobacteria bacterium]HAA53542.1 hypothetical protein [Myxococcales bacterium]|tara:strand:- start:117 stop:1163 length:1047 start_codon:yes stop_codon:yes gene_type:complete